MIYALELGNEPDHWGDNKEDKVHLLKKRVKTPVEDRDFNRYRFEDYMDEIEKLMPFLNAESALKDLNIQGPSNSGSNTNQRIHWNDNLTSFYDSVSQMTDNDVITSFHRYGMSGFSQYASMKKFMSDPPTDGSGEERNTLEWVGKVANAIIAKGGEFVHGEGNTVTGSGRPVLLEELNGIDRSYEAGVWTFNNLLEMASRNVTRSHVHGLCGSSFAPIYVPYQSSEKNKDYYRKLRVTPIFGGMIFFNRLLDGGKDAIRITVPSAYIGYDQGEVTPTDPVTVSPYYKHYYLENASNNRKSMVYVNKDPTKLAVPMAAELDSSFCPSTNTLKVERLTKVIRNHPLSKNPYDQYTTKFNGQWYDQEGTLFGSKNHEKLKLGADGTWNVAVDPLTAVVVHCDDRKVTSQHIDPADSFM